MDIFSDDVLSVITSKLDVDTIVNLYTLFPERKGIINILELNAKKLNKHLDYKDFIWISKNTFNMEKISKSFAISTFRVTKKQLQNIKFTKELMYILIGSSRKEILSTVYLLSDIIKLCLERHNSINGLIEYNNKLKKRKHKKQIKDEQLKEQRKENLKNELEKVGLTLRDDSYFCHSFIEKDEYTIPYIIQKMSEAKYLHEYCDLERARNRVFSIKYWYISPEELRDWINETALKNTIFKDFPPEWPWLHNCDYKKWNNKLKIVKEQKLKFSNKNLLFKFLVQNNIKCKNCSNNKGCRWKGKNGHLNLD